MNEDDTATKIAQATKFHPNGILNIDQIKGSTMNVCNDGMHATQVMTGLPASGNLRRKYSLTLQKSFLLMGLPSL
jgi:hypothetical protein